MNRRRLLTVAAAITAAAVSCVTGLAAPAAADPGAGLLVGAVRATPGQLRFVLTGPALPAPAGLTADTVTVRVGGTKLPVEVKDASTAPRSDLPGRGVVLAVDTGATMTGAPLAAVETAVFAYLDALPQDVMVGLVAFGTGARTVVEPTYDRTMLRSAVGTLSGAGASALYDGVGQAAGLLASTVTERRVVVLTDSPDIGSTSTAADATAALVVGHATLDLVSYGAAAVQPAVSKLAADSGGQAQTAADSPALGAALRAIAGRFPAPVAVTATVPTALSGASDTIEVSVSTGDHTITATAQVTFAVDPGAVPALATVRLSMVPTAVLVAGVASIGLGIVVAGFVGMYLALGRSTVRRRLLQLEHFGARAGAKAGAEVPREEPEGSVVVRTALSLSEKAVQRQGRGAIEVGLDRAGIALRPAEWMLVRAAVAVVVALLLGMAVAPWVGLPGLLVGWLVTAWYRKQRAGKRAARFGDLLPEALQLVVGALRSGFSLMQAIDAVAREGPEPVAGEFARAMAEIRLGGEIEAALERTAERNSSRDLAWLVMAIRIQREVGGNLSEVMETAVETMRERGRLMRHVRGLSAEGRMSAYVLIGMPIVLSAWLFMFRADYIRPLYTEPLGMILLGVAVLMVMAGTFWISRLVKVEV